MKPRIVSVFGSSKIKEPSKAWHEAYEAGKFLAQASFVVANGGFGGTMLAAVKGAKDAGGSTIGVTTGEFPEAVKNDFIDQEIQKSSWHERLHQLVELADGFLVLDGGTGTIVEFLTVWEMSSKKLHRKPIAVLGQSMQSLARFLEKNPEVSIPGLFLIAKNPKAAVNFLADHISHA
ncbi:MAG: LOG family protein [Candidatus Omnitrophica bacterium]|nr:LOG family protein [Candidatus Omnitrophota bacterium]